MGDVIRVGQMREQIAAKLHMLGNRYKERGLNNGDGLLPPADVADITETERRIGFPLPEPLRAIYAVFGGQESILPGTTGIFGSHRLHTPLETAISYEMYQQAERFPDNDFPPAGSLPGVDWLRWHPALIPFASWDAYSLVMCRHTHRIYEYEPYSGLSERKFDLIDTLLEVILQAASTSTAPSLDFISPE